MITLDEMSPGIAPFLDPDALLERDVFCPRDPWDRILKTRPYLFVSWIDEEQLWTPLSTSQGGWRYPRLFVPSEYRTGSKRFVEDPIYVCGFGQHLIGDPYDFQVASEPDRGWRGNRNRIDEAFLPEILEFLGLGRSA
jgi:hypothetical protein